VVVSTHGKGIFQTKLDVPIQPNIYLAEFPCQGREFTLFASRPSESDNLSYQWFANGEAIPDLNSFGISGPSLDEPVNFQVEVTNNSTGASGLSNELIITPENNSFCSALSVQSLAAKGLKIFPNPARDHVKISGNRLQPHWQYSIIGLGGNEVLSGQLNNGDIDISHLSKGIYVLKVHTDKELLTDKFVKQ